LHCHDSKLNTAETQVTRHHVIYSYLQIKILPVTPHHNVSKEQSGAEFISIPLKTAEHVMVQYNICFKQKCKYTQTVNIY